MKRSLYMVLVVFFSLAMLNNASADTYTFQPSDVDLMNLDHNHAVLWGITDSDLLLDDNEYITGASIFFDDIRNYNSSDNDLFLSLLNGYTPETDSTPHIIVEDDNRHEAVNYWKDDSEFVTLLHQYEDLSATAKDITYDFNDDEIDFLEIAIGDGSFALGFDADCHFYNNGITFTMNTAHSDVPEPATMVLFGTGLAGLAGLRRARKK